MSIDEVLKNENGYVAKINSSTVGELIACNNLHLYWEDRSDENPGLLIISEMFNKKYDENNNKSKLNTVVRKKRIKEYDTFIVCLIKINLAYKGKNNVDFASYESATQFHINRLQYQCNQLIYRSSFSIAIIVAILSAALSIGSICYTIYYGRGYLFCKPIEPIESYSQKDSITTLNFLEGMDEKSDKTTNHQVDTTNFNNNKDSIN